MFFVRFFVIKSWCDGSNFSKANSCIEFHQNMKYFPLISNLAQRNGRINVFLSEKGVFVVRSQQVYSLHAKINTLTTAKDSIKYNFHIAIINKRKLMVHP